MPRNYTITVVATAILAAICIAAFSFIVDPYKMYPKVPGLSPETSIDLLFIMRLQAPYAVENARPSVLITGNSRSATFPPNLLSEPGEVAYNASLPGASLREIRRMVEHAQAITPLKRLFIGVDWDIFLKNALDESASGKGKRKIDPKLQRLEKLLAANVLPDNEHRYRKIDPSLADRWSYAINRLEDFARSLFSMDATKDSLNIVFGSGPNGGAYHDDGTWDLEGNSPHPPMARYQRMVRKTYINSVNAEFTGTEMGELAELLDFTETHGIQTILFLLPVQGLLSNTMAFAGAWEQRLDWQRELVTLVNAHRSNTAIYGVEDQERIVLEAVDTPQPLFIDGVHLNRSAGAELLSCLIGICNLDMHPTRLDDKSINSYLKQSEKLRIQYAQENPGQLTKVRKLLGLRPNHDP
ncbi:Uncharacterised protein [Halioglobus japonicus]|nr:Uncharacterised protein [Halioglobus japonicus]